MRVINIVPPLATSLVEPTPIVLALGFFDGVHRGHQRVIEAARQEADKRQLPLAVMTFNVHPAVIYQNVPEKAVHYLSPNARKSALMAKFGVDILYVVHFTEAFSHLAPQAFVDQYLVGLKAAVVVAGFDYTYGPRAVANMTRLSEYAAGRFAVLTVPAATESGHKVSSTRIRAALDAGDVDSANALLGYHYQTSGTVVHGEARGRKLGYPTANIQTPVEQRVPGIGVYAVRMLVQGHWHDGMASVGRNVTFGAGRAVTVEINLFDFDADIYGESVKVKWVHYLRGELKFDSPKALINQMGEDAIISRAFLQKAAH